MKTPKNGDEVKVLGGWASGQTGTVTGVDADGGTVTVTLGGDFGAVGRFAPDELAPAPAEKPRRDEE